MPNACPTCGFPLDPGAPCTRCAAASPVAPEGGPTGLANPGPTTIPPQPSWAVADAAAPVPERPRSPTPAPEGAPSTEDTGSRRRAFDIAPVTGKHAAPRSSPDPTPPLWQRAAAFGIDAAIVLLVGLLFYAAGGVAYGLGDLRAAGGGSALAGALALLSSAPAAGAACGLLLFAITSGYFVWFQGAESRTPGMAIFGLRVVRTDGSPLGLGGAVQRWGAFLLAMAIFGLGVLWTAFSEVQRGLHDHLAGTQVVRA